MKPFNRTTLDLIAVALLVGLFAFTPRASGQNIAIGGQLEIATPAVVERTALDQRFLRIATKDGRGTLMAIEYDGTVTLNYGATISFSADNLVGQGNVGRLRGFIPVYVGDELVLLPAYRFVPRKAGEE